MFAIQRVQSHHHFFYRLTQLRRSQTFLNCCSVLERWSRRVDDSFLRCIRLGRCRRLRWNSRTSGSGIMWTGSFSWHTKSSSPESRRPCPSLTSSKPFVKRPRTSQIRIVFVMFFGHYLEFWRVGGSIQKKNRKCPDLEFWEVEKKWHFLSKCFFRPKGGFFFEKKMSRGTQNPFRPMF